LEKGVDEIINNSLQRDDKISWMLKALIKLALRSGASGAAAISASDISVEDDLANLCREPRCESYGLSTSCPPYVSGSSGFRELLKNFKHAIVIKIDVPLEILLSSERRDIMKLLHEIAAGIEQTAIKAGCPGSKAFAGGSCKNLFCHDHASCRMLAEGGECRNPRRARPSMSGFGINVSKLMQAAGWTMNRYNSKTDLDTASTAPICGLILVG
jgi:predicted metal-binding protein